MVTLTVENATSANASQSAGPFTITVDTGGTDRACVLIIGLENGATAPTVTAVTSAHVTWIKNLAYSHNHTGDFGTGPVNIEVWEGFAAVQLSSEVITVDTSTSVDAGNINFLAVAGTPFTSAPFDDPNPGATQTAPNTGSAAATILLDTTNNDNVLIEYAYQSNRSSGVTISSGWTSQINQSNHSPVWDEEWAVATTIVSSPQSSLSVSMAGPGDGGSVDTTMVVFTVSGEAIPPPTGAWASTETTDTFAASGGILGGSWHSVEAKDIFDFERWNGPHGPWGSTEHADSMSASGTSASGTTFDPNTASNGVDFQNDNLTITNTGAFGTPVGARSTTRRTSGKLYAEFNTLLFAAQSGVGIGNATTTFAGWGGTEGSSPGPAQDGAGIFQNQNGTIWVDQVEQNNWAGISLNNAVVGVAIDLGANLIWFQTNGGHWNGITGANPATGVGGWDISALRTSAIYLYAVVFGEDDQVTMNAGATAFTYSVPSGFSAWDSSIPALNPLQLDGYATGQASSSSFTPLTSATVTLTTTQTDDVIVLGIATGGFWSASQVTTITDTAGLTWHRRNRRWQNGGYKSAEPVNPDPPGIAVNQGLDIEVWWAHAPAALAGDVITVNVGGSGSISIIAFGVSGANYTTPWDAHSQAGGYIDNIGNNALFPAMAQLSTNAANCFLFGLHCDNISADSGVAQQPWTYVTSVLSTEHDGNDAFESFAYQLVEEPQIGTNVPFGSPYAGGVVFSAATVMFDSLVAAGETGTAQEIVWFWDAASVNNILQLSTGTTLTLNYSSMNFNLMVLVQVMIQSASGAGEVTSISESQGLVSSAGFERRSRVVTATPGGTIATEIWWAWMPMHSVRASDDTLTINTSGCAAGDIIAAQAWGLGGTTGAFGLGDPFWDINPSLPAENSSPAGSPVPNATDITTTIPVTMLVAWTGNNTQPVPGFVEPYITLVQAFPNTVQPIMQMNSNAPNFYMGFEYLFTPTRVTDETAEFLTTPEPDGWIVIADAIPVGPPQPPVGVWASTGHADTFSAHGFVPVQAAWHSTDHADEFTGSPSFAPYFGEGWLGWVPGHGTWASTESKDQMDFYGWVLGFGCVGQMATTERKDRFAYSNRATVTGVLQATGDADRWASAGLVLPSKPLRPFIVKRRVLIIT